MRLKKHAVGYNTVVSTNGVISARGVKSKPNDLQVFGFTHEVGEGEKSPDNPYILESLDSGAMTVDGINYGHSIKLTNNYMSLQVPVPIALNSVKGISDYLYKDSDGTWKLVQNIGKFVAEGTENFEFYSYNNTIVFYLNINFEYLKSESVICTSNFVNGIENKINVGNFRLTAGNNSICFRYDPTHPEYSTTLYLKSNSFSTIAELTSFLAEQYGIGTPLTVIYQLETPITHVLSDYAQALLNSFEVQNQNEIFVEGYPDIEILGYIQK